MLVYYFLLLVFAIYMIQQSHSFLIISSRSSFGILPKYHFILKMSTEPSSYNWMPLEPSLFSQDISLDGCKYAKDEEYRKAVLDLWEQSQQEENTMNSQSIETTSCVYYDKDHTPLYGHIIRPIPFLNEMKHGTDHHNKTSCPGILLYHTAAGPHDMFLFYRATQLVSNFQCYVLICDILSDSNGWSWDTDRTKYNNVRQKLMEDNYRLLNLRVEASVEFLTNLQFSNGNVIDDKSIVAMGWCLGAQPILEVCRIRHPIIALITFHGVFRRENFHFASNLEDEISNTLSVQKPKTLSKEILICNGKDDPFISSDDLNKAMQYFERNGYKVHIMQFLGAKHGFTNPAQRYNENDSFDYNADAAKKSWDLSMAFLERKFSHAA